MSVRLKAIHQAVALLKASGAMFAVEFEGQTFGNAKLAEPEKPRRSKAPPQFSWAELYLPFLDKCKPGDVFSHTVKTKDEAESLRGSLSSRMAKKFGVGSYLCTVTVEGDGEHKVEAMLVQESPQQEPA